MIHNKKANEGIGTLIIFIALILVAAVGAGVLIQTAASLQSKSLDVGRQTQEKITTDLELVQLYVTGTSDGYINGSIDLVTAVVRLGSGSSPVKLSDTVLKFDTAVASQALTYTLGTNASDTNYAASYLLRGENTQDGYALPGDLIQFEFYVQNGTDIPEATYCAFRIINKNGAIKPAEVTTPSAMVENTYQLYP